MLCDSYQDYAVLAGAVNIKYSDTTYTSAIVTVRYLHRFNKTATLLVNGTETSLAFPANATITGPLNLTLTTGDATVELEPIDFRWNVAPLPPLKGTPHVFRSPTRATNVYEQVTIAMDRRALLLKCSDGHTSKLHVLCRFKGLLRAVWVDAASYSDLLDVFQPLQ
jgi:hypothetical protein